VGDLTSNWDDGACGHAHVLCGLEGRRQQAEGRELRLYDSQFVGAAGTAIFALHDNGAPYIDGCFEVNEVPEATIARCIFDANDQCGVIEIASQRVKVTSCDFLRNGMTRLDLRGSTVDMKDSIAVNNTAGGFAFRKASRGTIE
jgi:hypothetical protein